MDIFGINVGRGGIYNVKKREISIRDAVNIAREKKQKRQEANNIEKGITKTPFSRVVAGLQEWKFAGMLAESLIAPDNRELIRVYRDITIDAHLWALIRTIQLKAIGTKFFVYNEAGEIDDELTKKFQSKWFRRFCMFTIEADFYGFSLVQMGDVLDNNFLSCELVPREYVVQQRNGVKKNLNNAKDLIRYDEGDFVNWVVPIGERENLGLLYKAAPLVIKKKEVLSAWSEAAEIFGMPTRIGRTNINSPTHRNNMEEMLENMGSASWGVFDKDDFIELIEGGKTDFYKIYDEFCNRVNSELSKLILLQTGTTDEKAFVGSANVHADILSNVIEYYVLMIEDATNEQLSPLMNRHGVLPFGYKLKADNEQKFTPKELFDMTKELLTFYKIDPKWINDKFEIEVLEKELPEALGGNPKEDGEDAIDVNAKPEELLKAVKNLYDRLNPNALERSVMHEINDMYLNVLQSCKH